MQVTQMEFAADAVAENPDDRIDLLEFMPTGEPLTRKDMIILCLSGIVAPALLLIWGWA
jgi:adenine C2-methylase RlmN of 23S rRNA A2503 and tRNA A37